MEGAEPVCLNILLHKNSTFFVSGGKIYDSRVQDTFVPGLSVFMGSVCQTEMD